MPDLLKITINGIQVQVQDGVTVAAAILSDHPAFRRSLTGELRGPVCGMGICFECRATVNGKHHQRTCQLICEEGMVVKTDE
jgi:hypothetical protein